MARFRDIGISGFRCGPSSNFGCHGFSGMGAFGGDIGPGGPDLDQVFNAGGGGIPATGVNPGGQTTLTNALMSAFTSAATVGSDNMMARFGVKTPATQVQVSAPKSGMNKTTMLFIAAAAIGIGYLVLKRR